MSEISDLFAKDPLQLTLEDRTKIIAHYRENRERYVLATQTKGAAGGKKISSPTLDLGDIGL